MVDYLSLPSEPGIYIYFDKNREVLYVGKAKNLKRRVSSYFQKNNKNNKVAVLVALISFIEYLVTKTPEEALFLEDRFIKQYKPKYNIDLKDDKTYPYLVITNEYLPRLVMSYNYAKNIDGQRFGPYALLGTVKTLTDIAKKVLNIRSCKIRFTEENIQNKKYKECLEHHIGNCNAPCVNKQTPEDYLVGVKYLKDILSGNTKEIIGFLKLKMYHHARKYEFERAQIIKENIETIRKYVTKNQVITNSHLIVDVTYIIIQDDNAYITYFQFNKGLLLSSYYFKTQLQLEETKDQILYNLLENLMVRKINYAKQIIVNFQPNFSIPNVQFVFPKKGEKAELLQFAQNNCLQYIKRELHKEKLLNKQETENVALKSLEYLKEILKMENLPNHIECFDNSNFHGSYPVSSCVVFKNGKPANKEYRKYIVKTVEGPDDFATMREVVTRRYKRLTEEQKELPDLIIIDGGKGQLGMAYQVLEELNIHNKIKIIGLAKQNEEIFEVGKSNPIILSKFSGTLKLIAHIRDEAHRFAITFHKSKRSKNFIITELQNINGVGEQTVKKILRYYQSTAEIKNVSLQELEKILPKKQAKIIFEHFQEKQNVHD